MNGMIQALCVSMSYIEMVYIYDLPGCMTRNVEVINCWSHTASCWKALTNIETDICMKIKNFNIFSSTAFLNDKTLLSS